MKTRVNGIETYFELTGPEEAEVVTFSHGYMADHSMWDPQFSSLGEFRVLRYDIRGHGQSQATDGGYELGLLADDLLALMDQLDIDCTHFVGSSLGGMVGLQVAAAAPDRLASLTLCNTRGHCSPLRAESRRERLAVVQAEGSQALVEPELQNWFSDAFRGASKEVMERASSMIAGTSPSGVVGCGYAIEQQDHSGLLSTIRIPCLIVVGEDDPVTPLSEAFDLHVGIDGSDMVVIPKTRHLATLEAADSFNDVLATFLKKYS